MDQKSDLIREDIDETRSALTEKLVTLEDQLRDKVENAKESVEDTIENVRATLRKLSPSHQVQQHPFAMVGSTLAAGLLVGRLIAGRREARASGLDHEYRALSGTELGLSNMPQTSEYEDSHLDPEIAPVRERLRRAVYRRAKTGPGLFSKLAETFSDEIQMVKGMALGAAIDSIRGVAKEAMPNFGEKIDRVLDSAMTKVGAEPMERSGDPYSPGWEEDVTSMVV
jgi:ElaB/YqjD/DUF883 family membrane-anchored ribosome-binding protein